MAVHTVHSLGAGYGSLNSDQSCLTILDTFRSPTRMMMSTPIRKPISPRAQLQFCALVLGGGSYRLRNSALGSRLNIVSFPSSPRIVHAHTEVKIHSSTSTLTQIGSGRSLLHHSQHHARFLGGQASSNHGCSTGRGHKRIISVRGHASTRAGRWLNQSRSHGPSGRDVTPGTISLAWNTSQCKVVARKSRQITQTVG